MEKLRVIGGYPLQGEVQISGAKNAVLPILAASLLAHTPMTINNVPDLHDVATMIALLESMGMSLEYQGGSLRAQARGVNCYEAPYDLVSTMRASILVLGPLLARFRQARVSFPGGCAIGTRPVNLHLSALKAFGVHISVEGGYINASCHGRLKGADIVFDAVTVTGTENILMAAVLAEGRTTLRNAAREPEVLDLVTCLRKMGAKISGEGTSTLVIEGVEQLSGCEHSVLADRIEAGTYLAAAAMTRGCVTARGISPSLLSSVLEKFEDAGAKLSLGEDFVTLDMCGSRPRAITFETAPFPGFPTDMQAQLMALDTVAEGEGRIQENIFENRFMHAQELLRMGADIQLEGRRALIRGIDKLRGAPLVATDLRASASLVLAGLVAEGETTIHRVHHIDRGYASIEKKLNSLGAQVARITNE